MSPFTLSLLDSHFGWLVALIFGFSLIGYTIYGAIWRLYLSPVAHFPGPLFAALTFWNEFYYDVYLGGKYTWKIAEYHERYGPIIRINPYEIHIKDPNFYDTLYVFGSKGKTNKWYWSMRMFGQQDVAAFDTLDHDKHRIRREPWNPYYSKQSVSRLQPLLIQSIVDKLCDGLGKYQAARNPVVMTHAFSSLTTDIISEYSFPKGYNLLDKPEFDSEHHNAWMELSKVSHVIKQFGWLYPLLISMPQWVIKIANPLIYSHFREQETLLEQTVEISKQRGKSDFKELTTRPSMMEAFMNSDLPEFEKTPERIKSEAKIAIGAGTLTTAHALKTATYHVLANPNVHARLVQELEEGIPDPSLPLNLRGLEQLPYLMAVMYEALRILGGTSHRLQRIFPDRALQYRDFAIPPGTPISMSQLHILYDPSIFPDPQKFDPDRWLPLKPEGQRLLKYLVVFGRGSRACVGKELGQAEILTTLANMFRKFGRDMILYETSRERDIDTVYDAFNPLPSRESNGLMVSFNKISGNGQT